MNEAELRTEVERRLRERQEQTLALVREMDGSGVLHGDTAYMLSQEHLEFVVQYELDELMPVLVKVREELGETGPLTEAQFSQASMLKDHQKIAAMSGMFRDLALSEREERKQALLMQLATHVNADLDDLRALGESNVTPEMAEDFRAKMTQRMKALTEAMLKPKQLE